MGGGSILSYDIQRATATRFETTRVLRARLRLSFAARLQRGVSRTFTAALLSRRHRRATQTSDPFDRLLVAQAQLEGLTIVTRDERIAAYDVETLAA